MTITPGGEEDDEEDDEWETVSVDGDVVVRPFQLMITNQTAETL